MLKPNSLPYLEAKDEPIIAKQISRMLLFVLNQILGEFMSEHLLEEDELLLYEEIFEREYGWLVPPRTRNPLLLVLGTRHLLVSEELWVPSLPFVYVISKIFAYLEFCQKTPSITMGGDEWLF